LRVLKTLLSSITLPQNFTKWFIVGVASFITDVAIFSLLFHRTEQVLVSNLVSALCSTSFNYLAHYFWTFNSVNEHRKTLVRYLLNIVFLWVISSILIQIILDFGVSGILSKILSLCILLPFNYFILRKFVYSRPDYS